jgi:hypothetical protein
LLAQDTDEMMFANPALGDAVTEFDNSAVSTPSFVGETVTMDMMYPEESMLALEQACSDAGGYYEELVGVLSCKFDDGAGGAVVMNMNNFANCSADTAACESVNIMEFMGQLLMSMGGTCDLPDMMKPDGEKPVAEEPVAEEPVAEEPVAEEPVADETPTADEPAETEGKTRPPHSVNLDNKRQNSDDRPVGIPTSYPAQRLSSILTARVAKEKLQRCLLPTIPYMRVLFVLCQYEI